MANNKVLHFPTKPIVMRPPDVLGDPHPLTPWYVPPPKSTTYTVRDGDSWESVAKAHGMSARALIAHNFQTTDPAYVNYYLKHITGCNKTYDDVNWAFSDSATPGKVYIPAVRDERDPYVRYAEVIPKIEKGAARKQRLAKVLHILKLVGNQGSRRLWYYDYSIVARFLDKDSKPQRQRSMTIITNGQVPYDGQTGFGAPWKVYPFQELIEKWALRYDLSPSDKDLEGQLVDMDEMIHRSWMNVQNAQNTFGLWGPLAYEFINHVNELSKSKTHLYSAYR